MKTDGLQARTQHHDRSNWSEQIHIHESCKPQFKNSRNKPQLDEFLVHNQALGQPGEPFKLHHRVWEQGTDHRAI